MTEAETTFLFVRHGQANDGGEVYIDDAGRSLTDSGHRDAEVIASESLSFGAELIVSSPMTRARQTAAYFEKTNNLKATIEDALAERHFGSLEGMSRSAVVKLHGVNALRMLETASERLELSGEESFRDAQRRVVALFSELVSNHVNRIIVISHGGPHSWLLGHLLSVPKKRIRMFQLDEGHHSLFVLKSRGNNIELLKFEKLNSSHF